MRKLELCCVERQTVVYRTFVVCLMQVGVKSIETGVWGAYQNVLINLKDVKDDDVRQKVRLINESCIYCID